MSARILPDSAYQNGAIIPATYFQALDTAQYQAIDADAGGTWSPSSPIAIAGAGMAAQGPWSFGASPALEVPAGGSLRLTHGDSDWVELGSGHSGDARNLPTSLGNAADTSFWTPPPPGTTTWESTTSYATGYSIYPSTPNGFVYVCTTSGTSNSSAPTWPTLIGATVNETGGSTVVWTCYSSVVPTRVVYTPSLPRGATAWPSTGYGGGSRLTMPIRVHHGATLTQVTVYFFVKDPHSLGVPGNLPQARVLRIDMNGNAVPLCSTPTTPGWQGNGWVNLFGNTPPSTPTLYYQGGALWGLPYPCDAGTIVDRSRFAYEVQIIDESGAYSVGGNTYFQALAILSSIPDLRPQ